MATDEDEDKGTEYDTNNDENNNNGNDDGYNDDDIVMILDDDTKSLSHDYDAAQNIMTIYY